MENDKKDMYVDSLIKGYQEKIHSLSIVVLSLRENNELLITENSLLIDSIKEYKIQKQSSPKSIFYK